jgi:hypothetical protein
MDNRYTVVAAAIIALLLLVGCGAAEPTATATPVPTDTPVPEDLSIGVPRRSAPVLDGTLSPDEWAGAHEAGLTGGGTLLLMHDGDYLYLGLRGESDSVGSICVTRGNELAILHSSMGVGTAEYKQTEEDWQRTRSFVWTWWAGRTIPWRNSSRPSFCRRRAGSPLRLARGPLGRWSTRLPCRKAPCA